MMFRGQQNPFDEAVGKCIMTDLSVTSRGFHVADSFSSFSTLAKATDENLTSENWEYILVWDPRSGN